MYCMNCEALSYDTSSVMLHLFIAKADHHRDTGIDAAYYKPSGVYCQVCTARCVLPCVYCQVCTARCLLPGVQIQLSKTFECDCDVVSAAAAGQTIKIYSQHPFLPAQTLVPTRT
jgi:hypothetical protein